LDSIEPLLDAEIIQMSARFLQELGLTQYEIKLNSLGCPKCRENYRSVLQQHLSSVQPDLCADCRNRFTKNIFRVFDCKNEKCRAIVAKVPLVNYLCNECRQHFDKVKTSLTTLGVNYHITPTLVRGLDYYTKTVFEITYPALGAQDAIGGGGRYDNLIASLGGPELGAMGFAMGIERLIIALQAIPDALRSASCGLRPLTAFVVTVDEASRQKGFELLSILRQAKISADMDYEGKSIKAQMRQASRINAMFVIIIGPDELASGSVKIKNMQSGQEESVNLNQITDYFKRTIL
jgi:histidyl-tRNA synthetase